MFEEDKKTMEEKIVEPEKKYYHEEVRVCNKKQKRPWAKYIATCLIVSIAGGGSFGVGLGWSQNYFSKPISSDTAAPVSTVPTATAVSTTTMSKKEVIKMVMPSVVSISTTIEGQTIFGVIEGTGAGSGIVFYEDDEKVGIVTNNHVIQNAKEVFATFDTDKTVKVTVAGKDSSEELAVLTVSKEDLKKAGVTKVTVATLGDSDKVEVGDDVYAIGNALGEGLTATDGMISAVNKNIKVQGSTLENVLQTNATINQGNSGGALVNTAGEVIGINTAKEAYNGKAEAVEGTGYAIPSNTLKEVAEILLEKGSIPKPGLGVYISNIPEDVATLYRIPMGVLVREVIPNSGAEEAGIEAGDIIVEVNGKKVLDTDKLSEILKDVAIGEKVSVYVVRDGDTSVKLDVEIKDMGESLER